MGFARTHEGHIDGQAQLRNPDRLEQHMQRTRSDRALQRFRLCASSTLQEGDTVLAGQLLAQKDAITVAQLGIDHSQVHGARGGDTTRRSDAGHTMGAMSGGIEGGQYFGAQMRVSGDDQHDLLYAVTKTTRHLFERHKKFLYRCHGFVRPGRGPLVTGPTAELWLRPKGRGSLPGYRHRA